MNLREFAKDGGFHFLPILLLVWTMAGLGCSGEIPGDVQEPRQRELSASTPLVEIDAPDEISSYGFAEVEVRWDKTRVSFDALRFEIREGKKGGVLSAGQRDFSLLLRGKATLSLMVWSNSGTFHVDAFEKSSPNTRIASDTYEVVHPNLGEGIEQPPTWSSSRTIDEEMVRNLYGHNPKVNSLSVPHKPLVVFPTLPDDTRTSHYHGVVHNDMQEVYSSWEDLMERGKQDLVLEKDNASFKQFIEESSGGRFHVEPTIHKSKIRLPNTTFKDLIEGANPTRSRTGLQLQEDATPQDDQVGSTWQEIRDQVPDSTLAEHDSLVIVMPLLHRWDACPEGPEVLAEDSSKYETCFGRQPTSDCTQDGSCTCGNGVIEPGEECDDGNGNQLDACSSSCRYLPPFLSVQPSALDNIFRIPMTGSGETEKIGRINISASEELTTVGIEDYYKDRNSDGDIWEYSTSMKDPTWSTVSVMAHEFGHILGLPDIYPATFDSTYQPIRSIKQYGLMANGQNDAAQLSLPFRAALGWVDESDLLTLRTDYPFNYTKTIANTNKLSLGSVNNGLAGIRVKLADQHYWFIEYRRGVDTKLPDAPSSVIPQKPSDGNVLMTDYLYNPHGLRPGQGNGALARPEVAVPEGRDSSDGPTLANDYDVPIYRDDRKFTASATTNGDSATVTVKNEQSTPDCSTVECTEDLISIEPWGMGTGEDRWKSPAIEVEHPLSMDDSDLENVPAAGYENQVVAKVRNETDRSLGIAADFYIKAANTGGGVTGAHSVYIGTGYVNSDPGDPDYPMNEVTSPTFMPSKSNPPQSRDGPSHLAILVRIRIQDYPNAPEDGYKSNNEARSHYGEVYLESQELMSTSCDECSTTLETEGSTTLLDKQTDDGGNKTRVGGVRKEVSSSKIVVRNPLPTKARVRLDPQHTNPDFTSYLENRSLVLDAGASEKVRVGLEYEGDLVKDWKNGSSDIPENTLNIKGIATPLTNSSAKSYETGGMTLQAEPALVAEFENVTTSVGSAGIDVEGVVSAAVSSLSVQDGHVAVAVHYDDGKTAPRQTEVLSLNSNGEFGVNFQKKPYTVDKIRMTYAGASASPFAPVSKVVNSP